MNFFYAYAFSFDRSVKCPQIVTFGGFRSLREVNAFVLAVIIVSKHLCKIECLQEAFYIVGGRCLGHYPFCIRGCGDRQR